MDYFIISVKEFSESQAVILNFIPNNVKDIKIFTERGYLKLVKSFTDDLSWEVQDILVDSYFKLKQVGAAGASEQLLIEQIKLFNRVMDEFGDKIGPRRLESFVLAASEKFLGLK